MPKLRGGMGISEKKGGYNESLRLVGKQDEEGGTIGISYFSVTGLRIIPLVIRILFFLFLVSLLFVQQPFGWLPLGPETPDFLRALHDWEAFSLGTWMAAVAVYLLYFAVSLVKNSIFMGQPGAEIHFTRHKKIVKTVRPGERAIILDPRVKPYAVVSTKPMVLQLEPVEGTTQDNISLDYRGALIIRVANTYKLLEQGGFGKFLRQIKELYESIIKDAILQVEARDFNRFFIEEVATPEGMIRGESVTQKLSRLESSDLSVELLTDLSEIDEVDVSKFLIEEPAQPRRRKLIGGLQRLADNYGIEIVDHVPLGNLTSNEYLQTLALPLISSITRLRQATEALKGVVEEEIDEEITASVAGKKLGVLKIDKIIKEIQSVTQTLKESSNESAIVAAKEAAMENTVQGLLASVVSTIESLKASIKAKSIDIAGIERYVSELEQLYQTLEREFLKSIPRVESVMAERLTEEEVLPNIDIIESMLGSTGTDRALESLKMQLESQGTPESLEEEVRAIEARVEAIQIEERIASIQEALAAITSDVGISTDTYSPENVKKQIDEIAHKADVVVSETESAELSA